MPESSTVKWVCQTYPQRIQRLLESLDLTRTGLEAVRAACEAGDLERAGTALLDYYRTCASGKWLRGEPVKPGTARDKAGDEILSDIFTFYGQTDRVPRREGGGWDWAHAGPAGDREWTLAFNRHFHLVELLRAYRAGGNPEYAVRLDEHVRDWIVANMPYPARKNANLMWRGLEVSFRVKAWARAFYGLQSCGQLTPAARLLILTSLPEHADYLCRFHGEGNWITMELSGLATVAAAWPEFKESSKWMDYAGGTLVAEFRRQVYPDGVQQELTTGYHSVALNNFEQFAQVCRDASLPLPEGYSAGLEKMWNYLAWSIRPDGHGPLNNDSDLTSYRQGVIHAAKTFNRPDWLYLATNGREGDKPDHGPSIVLPWAGQAILRSGWDAHVLWAFFDIGPWGTAHQHSDKLHLSLVAFGRDLLVDSGRFNYVRGEGSWRTSYAQASVAHNVILLDGKGQAPGPKATTQPIPEADYAVGGKLEFARGSCDHFDKIDGKAAHKRVVIRLPGPIILVADRVETDRPRRVEAIWHWHPDCTVASEDGSVLSTDVGKANLRIVPLAPFKWNTDLVKGQKTPQIQGWYSPKYNEWAPATASVMSARVDGSVAFAWLLAPGEGPAPAASGEITPSDDRSLDVRFRVGSAGPCQVHIPWMELAPRLVP